LRRVVADQAAGWPTEPAPAKAGDVGHRFVGTGMCRRNGPTPRADFQHMDVLKAQSLGASFWFRLSSTGKQER